MVPRGSEPVDVLRGVERTTDKPGDVRAFFDASSVHGFEEIENSDLNYSNVLMKPCLKHRRWIISSLVFQRFIIPIVNAMLRIYGSWPRDLLG